MWIRSIFMAQSIVSWFLYDGAIRVHVINAVGRRKSRIIEVEVVDTGEKFHGSARRLERMVRVLQGSDETGAMMRPGRLAGRRTRSI
jgi:hypothetical protein